MQLKLNLNGSVKPLSNYLKNFSKIRTSLLLEIDTKNCMFVAKVYTEDKGAIRFSAISFEECNVSVVSDNFNGERDNRIKLGIVSRLPRFIKMLDRMAVDSDKDGKCDFSIIIDYDEICSDVSSSADKDYIATKTTFKSKGLSMKMDGYRTNEFKYLSDDVFNNSAFRVDYGCKFAMSSEILSTIIGTSDIFAEDSKRDGLVFMVEDDFVYVTDRPVTEGRTPNFNMVVSQTETNGEDSFRTPIYRDKFIDMLKGSDESYDVTIGYVNGTDRRNPRILFDSKDSMTRIVIASIIEG